MLYQLALEDCVLTDSDIEDICSLSLLFDLNLARCPISTSSLKRLSALPNLCALNVQGSVFGPESIAVFHQFKKMQRLRMDRITWAAADRAKLKAALPSGCLIVERSGRPSFRLFFQDD